MKNLIFLFTLVSLLAPKSVGANEVHHENKVKVKSELSEPLFYPQACWTEKKECLISTGKNQSELQLQSENKIFLDQHSVLFRDLQGNFHLVKGFAKVSAPHASLELSTEYGKVVVTQGDLWLTKRADVPRVDLLNVSAEVQIYPKKNSLKSIPLAVGQNLWLGPQTAEGNQLGLPSVYESELWVNALSKPAQSILEKDIEQLDQVKKSALEQSAQLYSETVKLSVAAVEQERASREARLKAERDENQKIRQMFRNRFSQVVEE